MTDTIDISTNQLVLKMYQNLHLCFDKIEAKFNVISIAYNFILTTDGLYFIDIAQQKFILCDDIRLNSGDRIYSSDIMRLFVLPENGRPNFHYTRLNLGKTYSSVFLVGFLCDIGSTSYLSFYLYKGFKKDSDGNIYIELEDIRSFNESNHLRMVTYLYDGRTYDIPHDDCMQTYNTDIYNLPQINSEKEVKMFEALGRRDSAIQSNTLSAIYTPSSSINIPGNIVLKLVLSNGTSSDEAIQTPFSTILSSHMLSPNSEYTTSPMTIDPNYMRYFDASPIPPIEVCIENEKLEFNVGCVIYINNCAILCTEPLDFIISEEAKQVIINKRINDRAAELQHAEEIRRPFIQDNGNYVRFDQGRQMDPSRLPPRQPFVPQLTDPNSIQQQLNQQSQQMIAALNQRTEHLESLRNANTGIPHGIPNRRPQPNRLLQRTQGQLFPSTQ